MGLGVLLFLLGASAGYFYGVASSGTKTVTNASTASTGALSLDSSSRVDESFVHHVFYLSTRNVSGITSQFAANANVTWLERAAPSFGGNYSGIKNIRFLMNNSFIGHGASFALGNLTYRITLGGVAGRTAIVYSNFAFVGLRSYLGGGYIGSVNGTVSAQDYYSYSSADGQWLISQEVWNFTSYSDLYR